MPFVDKHGRFCGFLDIDEDDKKKKFQRRYFILKKSRRLLEWYADSPSNLSADDAKPLGNINLDYITKVDEVKKMKFDFCFVINTPYRQYFVQASNQAEVEEWVETLNDASKIIVPPEVILQHSPQENDASSNPHDNEETNGENNQSNCTYRTEIVGNVVVKKKICDRKKHNEEPISPPCDSTGFDRKHNLSPESMSLHTGFFSADEEKDVIKKGWAVKQGHVDREPIRSISIGDILAAKKEDGEMSKQRDNLFLVATTDKLYYIQTDTPAEMHNWVKSFNATITTNAAKKNQGIGDASAFGSVDALDEPRPVASSTCSAPQVPQLKKQSSSQQLVVHTSKSFASPDPGNSSAIAEAASGNAAKKFRKGHRRAESEVTVSHALEAVPISLNSIGVNFHEEDVKARPESVNLSALPDSWNPKTSGNASGVKPNHGTFLSNRLNAIDTRSAIKPSAVKKKKNPGVLFSFNTMLSKKQDKIEREKARYTKV